MPIFLGGPNLVGQPSFSSPLFKGLLVSVCSLILFPKHGFGAQISAQKTILGKQ